MELPFNKDWEDTDTWREVWIQMFYIVSADDIVDRHICGACRTEFHNVDLFLLHKRQSCPALLRSVTDVSQGPGGLPADSSTDNSSSQAGDQGVVATPPSSVQQPPQPLIQDETIGTSLSAVDETGEGAGYMITPPQGHEYIQTSHRPQEATQSPPLRLQPQVLVTDKGEFILLQPDTQGRLSSDDTDHQNQAVVSLLQQLKASQNVNIANKENEFINSSEDQSGVTAQQGTSDRVPRMQLDHNGTFSLIPNSQLPANLQVPSSQSQTVTEESEAVEGIHQRQLTNPQQDVIYQSQALSESSQISSGIHVSPNMHDLAQQAARLSGVVDNDMQPVDITRVEQLESNQYAVHIRTMNQEPEADSVGPILQIPDSNIQEGLVIGPVRDCVSQAAVDSQIISSTGSTLLAQNEMVLGRNFPKKVKSHHSVSPAKSVSKSKVSSKVQSTPDKKNTPPKPKSVPSKRYTCNYDNCSFSTPYMKDLERHIRTHTGEKPYKCGHCVKAFSRVDKLRLHIRAHTGDKPYKCTYCAYSAVDSSSLKKHMIVHTDERPFQCQVCPYSCRNQSQLTVHLRTHTGDSPFPCPFCPSKFKIKSDLRRHLRVHTGEKPYTCEKCDARCATKGNLSSHMKVHHSEQNQMKCGECEFVTSSKKSLREHAKEHDYVDPECVCPVCKYKCANKEVLKNHSTTHEPDKPHKCVHCPFTTRYRANLMEHVKRKHFDLKPFKKPGPKTKKEKEDKARRGSSGAGKYSKLFECHLCPESFVRCDSLRSHVRLHEEMAKSTLSTALTVLKLQQPVIIPTSGDKQSDVSVQNATDHTHQIVDALQHGSVAESTGSGGHHITNTEVVDVVASRSYEQEIIERCKSGSNSDGTLRATYEFDGRNVEVTPLQVEYVSLNPVDNNTEPRPPEGSNPSDRERRYSDRVRHGTVNVPETCHYPIRLNQDKEQNSGHTQLSRETNLSANNSDRIFVVQSQSFDSQTTNVDPQFVSHGTQGNSHFTVSDMQMRSSAVQNMGGDSTEGVFLQNTPTSLPEQSDIQQTLNTPASEINTEPRPPQVCQIPSIQLVQNISFPLIRLPSGQIIPLNSQQSQQVLGSAQQQLSGDQSTFSNPSSVDEIQNEVETSPQHHNVPVQLMSPQTVTEGVAQMIDASGNSVPTTIQLVIPSSLSNVDSLKQAGVHTPTKAVNPTSGSPIVTPRGDVDSSRIQMQGKAISTLSDISQTLTMPGSTLLLGNDTVRQSGIPGSMVVTLPIQVTALPTDSEIAEDGCAQYPTVQNLVLNPNVRGQAHQQITGECKEIS